MRIGIDLTWMGDRPAGVGTMTGDVIRELQRREDIDVVLFSLDKTAIRPGWRRHLDLYRAIKQANLNVLWQTGGWLPLLLPRGLKTIQTVHDLISYDHPEWFPQTGLSRWWSHRMRVPSALRRASHIHAVSQWTADSIVRIFPEYKEKVFVAHEGVSFPSDVDAGLVPEGINRPFLLVLGTVEPRKNIETLCAAFSQFAKEYQEPYLVIAGREGWRAEQSLAAIDDLKKRFPGRVYRLGYVDEATKWALLKEASVLVMISYEEGFGRPVVEAMACGTPVIAAHTSALMEVADEAAVMVKSDDVDKISRAMWRILYHSELPQRVVQLGQKRAERFTVEQMVGKVLTIL